MRDILICVGVAMLSACAPETPGGNRYRGSCYGLRFLRSSDDEAVRRATEPRALEFPQTTAVILAFGRSGGISRAT
jgi:hypothetical protein